MLGAVDTACLKKENCKPECVRTFIDMYGLQIPEFQGGGQGWGYEACLKYENCKPFCVADFKNNSQGAMKSQEASAILKSRDEINASIRQSQTRTYLLIGGSVVAVGVLLLLVK